MRSKHFLWLLVLALVALALPGTATASSSRVQGMGLQPDYLLDYTNVQTYPSAIVRYQNLVYGDLGVKDPNDADNDLPEFEDNNVVPGLMNADRSLGVFLGNLWGGRLGTFGVILNENASPLSPALGGQYFNRNPNEAWNILWGYKFSNFALGLEFNRSFSSYEDEAQAFEPYTTGEPFGMELGNARQFFNLFAATLGASHWNTLGIGAGVTVDWETSARPNFADFSAEIRQHSFEDQDDLADPATLVEDDAGMSFALNARAHISGSDVFHLVPVVNYYRLDLGVEDVLGSAENTVNGIQAGLAGQWRLRDSDWLVVGASFQNVTMESDDLFGAFGPAEVEYLTVPNLFAAVESNLWSWLSLRLGASKPAYSRLRLTGGAVDFANTLVDPDFVGETEIKDSPMQYAVGLGFHLGRVDLDAVLNQDFPFTGSWLASGNSEIPFTRLSATYRW